jgi:predicted dehydrogenase
MNSGSASKLPRIGVAGLGQLSVQVHLPNLRSVPGVRIAALADSDPQAREKAACLAPGAHLFASTEELLTVGGIDAVLIATPTAEHARHARLAINAGLAFYLEKPLASEFEDGVAVVSAAERAGVAAMMGFNYRFHPRIAALREGLAGVQHAESTFTIAPRPLPEWKHRRSTGGGVLLDLASHHFDLLMWLLRSPVAAVSARVWSERTEDDCADVELEFEDGRRAACSFSFCRNESDVMVFSGPGVRIVHNRYAPLSFPVRPVRRFAAYQWERLRAPWKEASFRRSISYWAGSLRSGTPAPVTLGDGLESLRIVCAAEQSSARGGAPVRVMRDADNRG